MNQPLPLNGDQLNQHLARLLTQPAKRHSPAAEFAQGLREQSEPAPDDTGITGTGFGVTPYRHTKQKAFDPGEAATAIAGVPGQMQKAFDPSQGRGGGKPRSRDPLLDAITRTVGGVPRMHR